MDMVLAGFCTNKSFIWTYNR